MKENIIPQRKLIFQDNIDEIKQEKEEKQGVITYSQSQILKHSNTATPRAMKLPRFFFWIYCRFKGS